MDKNSRKVKLCKIIIIQTEREKVTKLSGRWRYQAIHPNAPIPHAQHYVHLFIRPFTALPGSQLPHDLHCLLQGWLASFQSWPKCLQGFPGWCLWWLPWFYLSALLSLTQGSDISCPLHTPKGKNLTVWGLVILQAIGWGLGLLPIHPSGTLEHLSFA